ncbi:MAG: LysM peptidoglycan-binding domain-containing protein [Nitrospirae bacterium]|nr:LysM peptidoglycan-binding domain-containing protein [Nitrospirota bacterium]MBF0542158.1 LysM peptidoglycan-binding domain-containing protein [Nitrospirota bacterium]
MIIFLFSSIQLSCAEDPKVPIKDKNASIEIEENFRYYTVKKNDSISEIAWALNVNMSDLMKWNPDISIRGILPGQQIKYKLQKDILMTTLMEGRATRDTINNALTRMSELMSKHKTATDPTEIAELDNEIGRLKGLLGQNEAEPTLSVLSKQLDTINKNINKVSPPSGISDTIIIVFMGSFSILFVMMFIILKKIKPPIYIAPIENKAEKNKIEIKTDLPVLMFEHLVKVESNIERHGVDTIIDDTKSLNKAIKLYKKKLK